MSKKQQTTTENTVSGGEATTVVQAGTTGPVHLAPVITGDGATVINGDNHAPISHTFGRR